MSKGRKTVTTDNRADKTPVHNQFQELSDGQEPTPTLKPRELIKAIAQLPPEEKEDDKSDPPEDNEDNGDTVSIGSIDSCDTMTMDNEYKSLLETIRTVSPEQAIPFTGKKKNYADVVKLREVLGSALANQTCSTYDEGFSWIVDTETDYTHRTGASTPYTTLTMPKGPTRPTEPLPTASSNDYKWYTLEHHKYKTYVHWNKQALIALEHRFPGSLTPKRNKFEALPSTYTIREAVEYLESLVDTAIEKREAYCAILYDTIQRKYQPNLEGPTKYFAEMKRDQHSIAVLKQGDMTYDTPIIHSQNALRQSGIPMKEMRIIDEAWTKEATTTIYVGQTKWTAFTTFYTKRIKDLHDDGMDQQATHLANRLTQLEKATHTIS